MRLRLSKKYLHPEITRRHPRDPLPPPRSRLGGRSCPTRSAYTIGPFSDPGNAKRDLQRIADTPRALPPSLPLY